jgi:tRNA (cmo5U34)-methyltransferase
MAQHQTDTNADIWKSEEVARRFAVESQEREQRRSDQLRLMALLLPFNADDTFTFVDLGAGTGAASRAILAEYPRATAILAEYSPQMSAQGEAQMTAFAGRYRYVEFDMLKGDWSPLAHERIDSAVSALSMHHLPDERKRGMFAEIFAHLRPGGWYVNFDPIKAGDDAVESVWERINDRLDPEAEYKRTHRSQEEHARHENHVRYMIPLAPQLAWLREAGFENVDVYWKRLDWVIYAGAKR